MFVLWGGQVTVPGAGSTGGTGSRPSLGLSWVCGTMLEARRKEQVLCLGWGGGGSRKEQHLSTALQVGKGFPGQGKCLNAGPRCSEEWTQLGGLGS